MKKEKKQLEALEEFLGVIYTKGEKEERYILDADNDHGFIQQLNRILPVIIKR